MTTTAEKIIRNWWHQRGDYGLMNEFYKIEARHRLNGFLDACEQFGHISPGESQKLFNELTTLR